MMALARQAAAAPQDSSTNRPHVGAESRYFALFFAVIGSVYAVTLLVLWPGILGEDSLAILLEVEGGGKTFHSGKPAFWYHFVNLTYGSTGLVEVPIALQLLLAALVFSRICAWCWSRGFRGVALLVLLGGALAPHVWFFVGSLYPDGIYAVAVIGLLFELWLAVERRRITRGSLLMVVATLPFAAFARTNGIVFIAVALLAAWWLTPRSRMALATVTLAWLALGLLGHARHDAPKHGILFPLALYETMNFLQPQPMSTWGRGPDVSRSTVEALERRWPVERLLKYYDRAYWDPLIFTEGGPQLITLPKADKTIIVRDFFRRNLWHNIPAFMGSRTHLFWFATLAQGGFPGLVSARDYLPRTQSQSRVRPWGLTALERPVEWLLLASYKARELLWSPLPGIALLTVMAWRGWQRRDRAVLLVTVPMLLQLAAIVFFSIAGEYRYLFPFYLLPAALLPLWALRRRQQRAPAHASLP